MIVDTSAVVTILREEPQAAELLNHIDEAESVGIGAPTLVESGIVLMGRLGVVGKTLLTRLVQESDMDILPFVEEHWSVALAAFARFGKGRHPAALNFGDCLTYATSKVADEPLLCIGEDFPQTDVALVWPGRQRPAARAESTTEEEDAERREGEDQPG